MSQIAKLAICGALMLPMAPAIASAQTLSAGTNTGATTGGHFNTGPARLCSPECTPLPPSRPGN